jgi:ATP-dependent helicase HrpB
LSVTLPVEAVFDALCAALADQKQAASQTAPDASSEVSDAAAHLRGAVLIAPPGAGKTTAVAPRLIREPWCSGQIIITSPRRIAARAAAERMAHMLGEKAGETAGYVTRLDTRQSAATRILVMTEAVFVNRIIDDPELSGVSAVLFDEAHERHLDSDLGLALALEARKFLREDLRLLVMSATIDGGRFASLMGKAAPVIESEGRSFPLAVHWLGSHPDKAIEEAMCDAICTAWRETGAAGEKAAGAGGDLLGFLPGVREIERVKERLEKRLPDVPIHALHGQIDPAAQRLAIARDPDGRRRIVLATAIAETSLTLDGVSIVVDSGLARLAEHDRASGTTHLVTRRASQAAATQRAGRAARQGPGCVYRLWEEAGHGGRPPFTEAEIASQDLAPMILKLAKWGTPDPATLSWIDPPPEASVSAARKGLQQLGALDEAGAITPWGENIAQLPMEPFAAAAVLFGAQKGQALAAAKLVLLMQERGLGGRSEDLAARLSRWDKERGKRAEAARGLALRWAKLAERLVTQEDTVPINPAVFLGLAKPDNIARKRSNSGEHWLSAGGRGFVLDPASPLTQAEWLIIADAQGQAKGARITSAAEISGEDVHEEFANLLEKRSITKWNTKENRAEARIEIKLGAIALSSAPDPSPDPSALVDILVGKTVENLEKWLPQDLLARASFAGLEALSSAGLKASAEQWLVPLLSGRRDIDVSLNARREALLGMLTWDDRQRLDRLAPRHFTAPTGSEHVIDYLGDDAPSVEVRAQALFGLDQHPHIGSAETGDQNQPGKKTGQQPLLLKLTSPAGRPIQSTRDLPGFWRGSWADVRKDMKGRYPKHRWPEEPWLERPSLKTKRAFSKEQS